MNTEDWYATKLKFAILIEDKGSTRYQESVFIFRVDDPKKAFSRALDIGRAQEEEYLGGFDAKRVRVRLVEVLTLDSIWSENLDGAEVACEPLFLKPNDPILPFDAVFHPEESMPGLTL